MKTKHFSAIAATFLCSCISIPAFATHSWNGYHWARITSALDPSFDLMVVNSTTSEWGAYVADATADWSQSAVLNMVENPGSSDKKTRRQCRPDSGTVRICNLDYGNNGWLGVAGISIDSNGHIIYGYTKLNDTYFSSRYYDTFEWRQAVTCQELGHDIGLGHQDENFNNTPLYSCMDYQDPPYPYPNDHDYEELLTIYDHSDSYDSYATSGGGGGTGGDGGVCNAPPGKGCNKSGTRGETGWGMSLGRRGQSETFIRIDPDGIMHLTHVTWAIGY